ncbi:hypothetical protein K439DRAFT_1640310 [Ramaria rubella]|nr:hypothetical protein K439DRAFT_1640310 [Ramaria rubella]
MTLSCSSFSSWALLGMGSSTLVRSFSCATLCSIPGPIPILSSTALLNIASDINFSSSVVSSPLVSPVRLSRSGSSSGS